MTDRGLPIVDGAPACPFVAFEDDRDARATAPDHRHRCFAEARPAPRALAHQEAYCLSSAFPVCPTFQDWARRESARARDEAQARSATPPPPPLPAAAAPAAYAADADGEDEPLEAAPPAAALDEDVADPEPTYPPPRGTDDGVRRNPPRDWSAPPPWLASDEAANAARDRQSDPPLFLATERRIEVIEI